MVFSSSLEREFRKVLRKSLKSEDGAMILSALLSCVAEGYQPLKDGSGASDNREYLTQLIDAAVQSARGLEAEEKEIGDESELSQLYFDSLKAFEHLALLIDGTRRLNKRRYMIAKKHGKPLTPQGAEKQLQRFEEDFRTDGYFFRNGVVNVVEATVIASKRSITSAPGVATYKDPWGSSKRSITSAPGVANYKDPWGSSPWPE